IKKFPYQTDLKSDSPKWIIDPYGNGYHILSKDPVSIKKEQQHSYHNKYSINTGRMNRKGKGAKETKGDYASAWIDHGLAPKAASYQYVVYPFLSQDEQDDFSKRIKTESSFRIERADSVAHIVTDKLTNTT